MLESKKLEEKEEKEEQSDLFELYENAIEQKVIEFSENNPHI